MPHLPPWLTTVLLLIASNVFMTFAWYFHLQKKQAWGLITAIAVSWLIALPEYILQVPANRVGSAVFTLPQLKILQEAITLAVFTAFAIIVAKQNPSWRDGAAMLLVLAAVAVSFSGRQAPRAKQDGPGSSEVAPQSR
ncbi:MAG: DMT family protein [Tepidisphaera sp.]